MVTPALVSSDIPKLVPGSTDLTTKNDCRLFHIIRLRSFRNREVAHVPSREQLCLGLWPMGLSCWAQKVALQWISVHAGIQLEVSSKILRRRGTGGFRYQVGIHDG